MCISTLGGLAIGVPGEVRGLYEAWKIGGKLPWKDLFQPTIKRLRDGWKVSEPLATAIAGQTSVLMRQNNLRQVSRRLGAPLHPSQSDRLRSILDGVTPPPRLYVLAIF